MAVDKLIAGLKAGDKELKWITAFINRNIDEDKSWNVTRLIKSFGKNIYLPEYAEHAEEIDKLGDEEFFSGYAGRMHGIVSRFETAAKDRGEGFFKLVGSFGYSEKDFRKNVVGYFRKLTEGKIYDTENLCNKTILSAMECADKWVRAKDKGTGVHRFAGQELVPYLRDTEYRRRKDAPDAALAKAVLETINELRLLGGIACKVNALNKEAGRIFLSDTQTILHRMVTGSDTPFIYEKLGGSLRHIMIDEHQDTSKIQWGNFKKLIGNSLATGGSRCLVVGDVKQSIYRWRNSDWHILDGIAGDEDLKDTVKTETLSTNYRSCANIVRFNNRFFTLAAQCERRHLADEGCKKASVISGIYSEDATVQALPPGKEPIGGVEITLLGDKGYKEESFNLAETYIRRLLEKGAKEENIAILARKNSDLSELAVRLKERLPQCNFISEEAFKLSSSAAVCIIVGAMKSLADRHDRFSRALLAYDYQVRILRREPSGLLFRNEEEVDKLLPPAFVNSRERLAAMPVNNVADAVIAMFGLDALTGEAAYVSCFFDYLSEFVQSDLPDLSAFCEYWDDSLSEKAVKNGAISGIRLLTIHKSKGLEFDHVILFNCDWKIYGESTIWVKTGNRGEPFSQLPVTPVKLSKIKDTVFNGDYLNERLECAIDSMNMLYVAFTRAKKNLICIGKEASSKNGLTWNRRSAVLQAVLPLLKDELEGCALDDEPGDGDRSGAVLRFRYGNLYVGGKERTASDNIFMPDRQILSVGIERSAGGVRFRQSNRSRAFVSGEDAGGDNREYIARGTLLHSLLSNIPDINRLDGALQEFIQEGLITDDNSSPDREELASLIRERIENNPNALVKEWFAPGGKTLRECSILTEAPSTGLIREFRPDRVVSSGGKLTVIDFKFGARRDAHHAQVCRYMELLRGMGHGQVDGFLWYVYNNEIVEVK